MVRSMEQGAWAHPTYTDFDGVNGILGHQGKGWTEKDRFESEMVHQGRNQERYRRGELLGSGGWSRVYKVQRVQDGEMFAGKSCRATHLMRREARILKSINHDHILKFIDWDEHSGGSDPDDVLLITDLCEGGTLQQRIDNTFKGLSGRETLQLTAQIASALDYLHSTGRFHSDVKPRNILIRSVTPLHIVLGDCGDILRLNRCHGTGDDMWALGVTMLGMVGQWPQIDLTKDAARTYPKKCHDHVVVLRDLNAGNKLVEELLMPLLAWDAKDRLHADACRKKAIELRDSEIWSEERVMLRIPDDFKPISFW
ncbi:hypothetical protein NLU13_6195 [Sarocladium strictum]|uniref:Protein kinase domain-containing protein n=1 Tax=Sarocladium strictum TaxID=5046 RepID=A0AA39L6W2_SARSR|nr:hypothetical protein NLU13_6195 [Sarocladium strictum]